MNFKHWIYLSIVLFGAISCAEEDEDDNVGNWVKQSDYEGVTRSGAVSFVIDDIAYVGLGNDGDDYLNDFWQYDSDLNFWQRIADFPGEGRIASVGFSADGKGYVGTGYNDDLDVEELKDFWEYDPESDTWQSVADFAGDERYNAVSFSIGESGYVGTGYNGNYLKDFWRYDPATDSWTQVVSLFGSKREQAFAFVIDGVAYVGGGINNGSLVYDFWSYRPTDESWTDLSLDDEDDTYEEFVEAMGRFSAVAIALNGFGYISTGSNGSLMQSSFEYDPSINQWDEVTGFEGSSRIDAVGFTVDSRTFLVTGRNSTRRYDDLWEFRPNEEYEEGDD